MTNDVYATLSEKLGMPGAKVLPQIIQRLATPTEAETLLALPATPAEFAAKFGMDEAAAEAKLKLFVVKGLALALTKEGVLRYHLVRHADQLMESSSAAAFNRLFEPVPDDLLELWDLWRDTDNFMLADERDREAHSRVIPVLGAVKDTSVLLPYEDIAQIVRDAPAVAFINCPCSMYRVTAGLCNRPLDVCLQFSEGAARYIEEQGIGKRLTPEQAQDVLRRSAKAGLVPTVQGGKKIRYLCNCDSDCCADLRIIVKTDHNFIDKSRFQAEVDQSLCNGCQTCVERCHFSAIEMRSAPGAKRMKAYVEPEKCYGCGACVVTCPVEGALSLKVVRPVEHIPLEAIKSTRGASEG